MIKENPSKMEVLLLYFGGLCLYCSSISNNFISIRVCGDLVNLCEHVSKRVPFSPGTWVQLVAVTRKARSKMQKD
jgi:hypothetical protein